MDHVGSFPLIGSLRTSRKYVLISRGQVVCQQPLPHPPGLCPSRTSYLHKWSTRAAFDSLASRSARLALLGPFDMQKIGFVHVHSQTGGGHDRKRGLRNTIASMHVIATLAIRMRSNERTACDFPGDAICCNVITSAPQYACFGTCSLGVG
jgi:hypothetical protein